MKKLLLILSALFAIGTQSVEAKKPIRLIADMPRECLKSHQARLICDNNNVTIVPVNGARNMRMTIDKHFDFTKYKAISFTLENLDEKPVRVNLYIAKSRKNITKSRRFIPGLVGDNYYLMPHEKREVTLNFPEPLQHPDVAKAFKGMRYTPYSSEFGFHSYEGDLTDVHIISFSTIHVSMPHTKAKNGLRISNLQVFPGKRVKNPKEVYMSYNEFYPFIDQYGQYKHNDWPGKTHSDADLQKAREEEEADLAAHKGPTDRNKYGGWANGPKHEATGRFYFKKVDGKWWFIDPEGCLWWSHGVVRVTPSSGVTPLDNRHDYFDNLPKAGSEFEQFYFTQDLLLKPYYTARKIKETYDFSSANIYRKYGKNYKEKYGEMAHRRLQSWGLNTIANSSDKDICLMSKTPYIERLEIHSAPINGVGGLWWQLSDPFDKSFKEVLIAQLKEREKELKDPYLVGLFVDNELKWGNESYLAEKAVQNPATVAVKRELVKYYQAKYGEISKLNSVWGTSFVSWKALLDNDKALPKQARADLVEFNDLIIHKYFRNCREVFDEYAPGVLYLGCRFAGSNRRVLVIGAQYCDAISHNYYVYTLEDYKQPEGVDKPMIIGEFHFGTRDRGLFHHSLLEVKNQEERGKAYEAYVRSALEHPNVVGTHWHQFSDQAATGRFDGENFNVGFTDICDKPYYEVINAIRRVGYDMYNIRSNNHINR